VSNTNFTARDSEIETTTASFTLPAKKFIAELEGSGDMFDDEVSDDDELSSDKRCGCNPNDIIESDVFASYMERIHASYRKELDSLVGGITLLHNEVKLLMYKMKNWF
jgi:hypothetical protein